MRLIDADLLLANARIFLDRAEMDAAYSESREVKADWDDAMRLIREAPTVDAVPVVRCIDCVHNFDPEGVDAACSRFFTHTEQTGFCYKGERRK